MGIEGHIHANGMPPLVQQELPCFISLLIIHYGEELTNLFYRLWNGVERASGKARASETEVFYFFEDMPVTRFF